MAEKGAEGDRDRGPEGSAICQSATGRAVRGGTPSDGHDEVEKSRHKQMADRWRRAPRRRQYKSLDHRGPTTIERASERRITERK